MQLMQNIAPYLGLPQNPPTDFMDLNNLNKERQSRNRDRIHQHQTPINWASVASWFMRPEGRSVSSRSPASAPDIPLTPTICTSIRCTVPGCSCDCFSPGNLHVRYCETCSHAWVPHALDKLGLGGGVEPVQATLAFDIASLVLYGCQALPIRLKILLDRLFSVLHKDEVTHILRGFGWTHEDYNRGYIMQEHGAVLDRWNICSAEEEPLVLQQFLRFGETRAVAQQLLMHVMAADPRYLPTMEADMKRLMDRLRPPPPLPPPPKDERPKTSPAPPPPGFIKPPPMSSPPATSPSPLNRLQNMQPFDFRKGAPTARPSPERRLSPPPVGLNLTITSPARSQSFAKSPDFHSSGMSADGAFASDDDDSEGSQSALNLSKDAPNFRPPLRKPAPAKRSWGPSMPPNLGTQLINPATGKKRVQCNVCLKTFCDKGALKIHFSAVHLREMHKCTVEGCNMMFSSRRSRNRHSANPNPKLHSPHLRRKISPHDGRTAQNHPLLLPPALAQGLGPLSFGSLGSLLTPPTSDLRQHAAALDLKQSMDSLAKDYPKYHDEFVMDEEDEEGIVVEGDDYETHHDAKKPKLSESDGDEELTSNMDSNEDSLSVIDSHSAKEDNNSGPENLVTKTSRKRKNTNPTKCAPPQLIVQNNGEINSDESSCDVFSGRHINERISDKMDVSEDLSIKKNRDVESENNNIVEKKSPVQIESEPLNFKCTKNGESEIKKEIKSENGLKNRESSETSEDLSLKKEPSKKEDGVETNNALRHLESLSQGHFGQDGKQEEKQLENPNYYSLNYLMNNNPPSPARSHSSSVSSNGESFEDNENYLDGFFPDIPLDKDNPRMCTACGKVFQNHFGVKTHYQNVHLKLMHKCTIEGCNAAFPSKRSRDRHSSNLNLHRKLLSTPLSERQMFLDSHMASLNPALHGEFLARLYGEQGLLPPHPSLDMAPPVFLPHLGFIPRYNGHPDSPASSPDVILCPDEDTPTPDKDGLIPCKFCSSSLKDSITYREHLEHKHLSDLHRCSIPGCNLVFASSRRRNVHSEDPNHPKPISS